MITKTEALHRGLLASGWTPVDTKSSRDCLLSPPMPLKDGTTTRLYAWLGSNGTARVSRTGKIGDAIPMSARVTARAVELGGGR